MLQRSKRQSQPLTMAASGVDESGGGGDCGGCGCCGGGDGW